jgi:hypothetical protein
VCAGGGGSRVLLFTVCYSWGVNSGCSQCVLAGRQMMLLQCVTAGSQQHMFTVCPGWQSDAK